MKYNTPNKDNISSRTFHVNVAGCQLRAKRIEPRKVKLAKDRFTLVFLHEGLGCIELWRDFPETLCQSTGCSGLVYERKGYGGSEKFADPWPLNYLHEESSTSLPALLNACQIDDAVLIGHSEGGTIALLAAAFNTYPVRAVITEAAHIFVEDITLEGIRKAVKAFETTHLKVKLARYHKENTERVFYRWANRWLSPEFYDWNIEEYLPMISCPVLVLQGEDDEYGTPAQAEGIASQVAGSGYARMIPGCGHVPHFQARDVVLKEMTEFIRNLNVPEAIMKWEKR